MKHRKGSRGYNQQWHNGGYNPRRYGWQAKRYPLIEVNPLLRWLGGRMTA